MSKTITKTIEEGAEMITSSLYSINKWKTQDELIQLDWLKLRQYGASFYLEKAESCGWIKSRKRKGTKGDIEYHATKKGCDMVDGEFKNK